MILATLGRSRVLSREGNETTCLIDHRLLTYGPNSLIFPRWDVIAIILSIFLLTYTYIEAKSNYHRGSTLVLRYVRVTNYSAFLY